MYGRLYQRKLKEDDYIMSCQKARRQLDDYIDIQAKRVNVDSAKKRAVLQHMDYQGFRQMVLGANIFPTKSKQLYSFSKGEDIQMPTNKFFIQLKQKQNNNQKVSLKSQQQKQLMKNVQGKSQLLCNSFRQFKKKFICDYPSPNQQFNSEKAEKLYNLVKNQDKERLTKIFNMQSQANIIVKIVNLFEYIINFLRQNDNQGKVIKQVAYQLKFLQIVLNLKNMLQFNLSILSKKQRTKIVDFLQSAKDILFVNSRNISDSTQINLLLQNEKKIEDQKIIDEIIKTIEKK